MGGTGPRARCSPSAASSPVLIASDAEAAGRAGGLFQLQSAPRLTDRGLRAALFAARTNSTPSARRSMAVPWRERPRDLAAICDHARGHRRGRSRHAVSVSAGAGDLLDATGAVRKGARNLHRRLHRPSHSIVRFAVARSRRSALLRPRCARLAALTARSANRLERNYRRPQREPA